MDSAAVQQGQMVEMTTSNLERTALQTLTARCVENGYRPNAQETSVIRKYGNVAARNGIIYGGGTIIATGVTMGTFLKGYRVTRWRWPIGFIIGNFMVDFANRGIKRGYLQDLLKLQDTPMANEAKIVIEELEGKNGPWYRQYGPSTYDTGGFDQGTSGAPIERVAGSGGRQKPRGRPLGQRDWDPASQRQENMPENLPNERPIQPPIQGRTDPGPYGRTDSDSFGTRDRSRKSYGLDEYDNRRTPEPAEYGRHEDSDISTRSRAPNSDYPLSDHVGGDYPGQSGAQSWDSGGDFVSSEEKSYGGYGGYGGDSGYSDDRNRYSDPFGSGGNSGMSTRENGYDGFSGESSTTLTGAQRRALERRQKREERHQRNLHYDDSGSADDDVLR
ncbi:hypothetical protein NDN08_001147 [Rhodosorus marinus]|uniref:OCIA domain-containing protein n=1 Tax=Rhodosorus marinus TaxID=101924 RepID=A0AAV8URG9_9RHOD|nr:hypothetical protein NDN08_001147 [Rhodosorus marinus]